MAYKWSSNLACVSTYKILERDDRLDQFEEVLVSFDEAKDYKVEYLTFFPNGAKKSIKLKAAKQIASKFIYYTLKDYSPRKENKSQTLKKWHKELYDAFALGNKTLADIAAIQDKYGKFKDESAKEKKASS